MAPEKKWELYDLAADRTELRNLAAEQPERDTSMAGIRTEWAKRANVTPCGLVRARLRQNTLDLSGPICEFGES